MQTVLKYDRDKNLGSDSVVVLDGFSHTGPISNSNGTDLGSEEDSFTL